MINRRSLITGLISLVAAPAIVRASSLMPVKTVRKPILVMVGDSYFSWDGVHPTAEEHRRFAESLLRNPPAPLIQILGPWRTMPLLTP